MTTIRSALYLLIVILLLIEIGHYNNVNSVRSKVAAEVQKLTPYVAKTDELKISVCLERK